MSSGLRERNWKTHDACLQKDRRENRLAQTGQTEHLVINKIQFCPLILQSVNLVFVFNEYDFEAVGFVFGSTCNPKLFLIFLSLYLLRYSVYINNICFVLKQQVTSFHNFLIHVNEK